MNEQRCKHCGYKGQLYYRKKSDDYRCIKCNTTSTKEEINGSSSN